MNNLEKWFVQYQDKAKKAIDLKELYRTTKAEKYLNIACPDPAIRAKDWKKPSDSIIEAMLDVDEELSKIRYNLDIAQLEAFLAKQALITVTQEHISEEEINGLK